MNYKYDFGSNQSRLAPKITAITTLALLEP